MLLVLGNAIASAFHADRDELTRMAVDVNIIPSQMEVAPLHCTVDITQKRRLFNNTKEIEKM